MTALAAHEPPTIAQALDAGRLKPAYWVLFALLVINGVAELFDFFIIGFLVSVVGPAWKLTFGETSIVLLAGGVGQVVGALPFAALADRIGRRPVILGCTLLYAGAAAMTALVPDRGWIALALLRLAVGIGFSGVMTSQLALLVEFSPTRARVAISTASGAFAPLGVLLASASVAILLAHLGWRGLAMLGGTPLVLAGVLWFVLPESARWLIAQGRGAQAGRMVDRYVDLPPGQVLDETPPPPSPPRRFTDLLASPSRFAAIVVVTVGLGMGAFGATLWGPTLLTLLFNITPIQAAKGFAFVGLAGIVGRFMVTGLAASLGRWPTAMICCCGGAACLVLAALFATQTLGGQPVFLLCLIAGAVFYDGGFTNILPYASELYPVRMAAQGAAVSHASSGLAKLLAPGILGLMIGAKALLTHGTAVAAVKPGFLWLAGFCAAGAVALAFFRVETAGRPMRLD